MTSPDRRYPLSGFKVLELGRLIAAPSCGQILGDLGADVIKIERVGSGDDVRNYGPPFLPDEAAGSTAASPFFLAFNRNKRSIAIDFSLPEGAELIRQLAGQCDVFIENYKVGSLRKYGLDRDTMRALHPELVYLSVSGFGQEGPYAARPATDVLIQGMSGIMNETGRPDGPPEKVGVPVVDMFTGVYGALAVVAELLRGERGGSRGGWAGVSLLDCGMAMMTPSLAWMGLSGEAPRRVGTDAQGSAPSGVFACRDGEVLFQAGKDADFIKLCRLLGFPELARDPRYASRPMRVENWADLRPILADAIRQLSREEFFAGAVTEGLVCGPVNGVDDAARDPQVESNHIIRPLGHPDNPDLALPTLPIRFDDTPPLGAYRHPPRLGEHTEEVLREMLGYDQAAIDRLVTIGAIAARKQV